MPSKPISVLITGANRGLGLEMVKQMMEPQSPLAPLGVLFACCRDPEGPKAEELQALAKKHADIIKIIRMDTADQSSIKQSAEQVGSLLGDKGLNLIINNAGILINSTVADSIPEDMANTFNTNVIGPMSVIQEFLPYLRTALKNSTVPGKSCRKAAVLNMSSIIGSIENIDFIQKELKAVPYRVSKYVDRPHVEAQNLQNSLTAEAAVAAALNMLNACAAFEFQKEEILFTLLHPGWVRTDMGTANAHIDRQESIEGLLQVISSLSEKHNGILIDYKGQTINW